MTIFTGIILYMMIYWLAIFAVLPFGNRPSQSVSVGNVHSAPENANMKRKFIVTGIVAAILWFVVFAMIHFGVIDFYDIARQMSEEDQRL